MEQILDISMADFDTDATSDIENSEFVSPNRASTLDLKTVLLDSRRLLKAVELICLTKSQNGDSYYQYDQNKMHQYFTKKLVQLYSKLSG